MSKKIEPKLTEIAFLSDTEFDSVLQVGDYKYICWGTFELAGQSLKVTEMCINRMGSAQKNLLTPAQEFNKQLVQFISKTLTDNCDPQDVLDYQKAMKKVKKANLKVINGGLSK